MKPEYNYLVAHIKPILKSKSVQNYLKRSKTNSFYRQNNPIRMNNVMPGATVVARLNQKHDSLVTFAETPTGAYELYTIPLTEFQDHSKVATKSQPAKAKTKTTPKKTATKKVTRKTTTK